MKIFSVFPSSTRERVSTHSARNMSRFLHTPHSTAVEMRGIETNCENEEIYYFFAIFSHHVGCRRRATRSSRWAWKFIKYLRHCFLLLERRRVHFQCRKKIQNHAAEGSEETWSGGGRTSSQWWILKLFINFIFTTRENLFRDNSNFSCRVENNRKPRRRR